MTRQAIAVHHKDYVMYIPFTSWVMVTAAEVIHGTLPLQTFQYVYQHVTTTGGAAT